MRSSASLWLGFLSSATRTRSGDPEVVTFDANDFTVIGLGLEFVGGFLLARTLLRSLSFKTTGNWADDVRSLTYSQCEARVGFVFFSLGLLGGDAPWRSSRRARY
jgi:hypothetical protein